MIRVWIPNTPLDVFEGLAMEDLLLERPEGAEAMLIVWRGPAAVVMGKNQNPWREVNLKDLEAEGIPLARRVSGGGAVYHDPGNLNLSWIVPRKDYRAETVSGSLVEALAELGLPARAGKTGALTVRGAKISGSAYCYRKAYVLHHCTLLLTADLSRMRRLLAPSRLLMRTHAVRSIPARVATLRDLGGPYEEPPILEALRRASGKRFGGADLATSPPTSPHAVRATAARLRAPDWVWNQTPAFHVRVSHPEGGLLEWEVRKGRAGSWKRDGTPLPDIPAIPFDQHALARTRAVPALSGLDLPDLLAREGWVLPPG